VVGPDALASWAWLKLCRAVEATDLEHEGIRMFLGVDVSVPRGVLRAVAARTGFAMGTLWTFGYGR
jgi:hypothetical protein